VLGIRTGERGSAPTLVEPTSERAVRADDRLLVKGPLSAIETFRS
jgi:hypothetical protein